MGQRKTKTFISLVLLSTLVACSPAPTNNPPTTPVIGGPVAPQAMTVSVRLDAGSFMKVLAARKTLADIDHYYLRLSSP